MYLAKNQKQIKREIRQHRIIKDASEERALVEEIEEESIVEEALPEKTFSKRKGFTDYCDYRQCWKNNIKSISSLHFIGKMEYL